MVYIRLSKDAVKDYTVDVSVMGNLLSNDPRGIFCWNCQTLPCDTNLHCMCDLAVLKSYLDKNGYLPHTIYYCEDNTCKENKNNIRMRFLAYLVHLKVVEEIHVLYMDKGYLILFIKNTRKQALASLRVHSRHLSCL